MLSLTTFKSCEVMVPMPKTHTRTEFFWRTMRGSLPHGRKFDLNYLRIIEKKRALGWVLRALARPDTVPQPGSLAPLATPPPHTHHTRVYKLAIFASHGKQGPYKRSDLASKYKNQFFFKLRILLARAWCRAQPRHLRAGSSQWHAAARQW